MSISSRIRGLCKQKGISINKLEKESGVGRGSVSRCDTHSPSVEKISAIADYFGVTTDYILTGEQKEKPPEDGELSEKNSRLIEWFRSLPQEKQKAILISLDAPKELIDDLGHLQG